MVIFVTKLCLIKKKSVDYFVKVSLYTRKKILTKLQQFFSLRGILKCLFPEAKVQYKKKSWTNGDQTIPLNKY